MQIRYFRDDVTSKDFDRNRGNRRYARGIPPTATDGSQTSRILAEYVSGYWLYIFIEWERHRSFVSNPPSLSLGVGHRRTHLRSALSAGVKNAETEEGWKGKGGRRNPLSRPRLLSHGKIFALLSISSSGKLKFSVTPDPRLAGKNSNE